MGCPKVSILWINFNSIKIIDIVLESLRAIKDLNYPNYELIAVDNGSNDGSYKIIKEYVKKHYGSRAKLIRLYKNLGFCGGNNIAFRVRDPFSKYVVLLNNDAVPEPDSLKYLIEEMENNPHLGSAQGVIIDYYHKYIDTIGGFMDEVSNMYLALRGFPPSVIRKSLYITYADGAYSIHRIKAIKKIYKGREKIFIDEAFAYLDDTLLGLLMWNHNYMVKSFPYIVAKHIRGATFKRLLHIKSLRLYFIIRNRVVFKEITNSRYKEIFELIIVRRMLSYLIHSSQIRKNWGTIYNKAVKSGKKLSEKLKSYGIYIDIYKAPIIRVNLSEAAKLIMLTRIFNRDINKRLLNMIL